MVKTVAVEAVKLLVSGLDKLAGMYSSFLGVLKHIPHFEWAGKAQRAIDKAREATRGWIKSLEDLPSIKNLTVKVNAKLSPTMRRLLQQPDDSISLNPPVRLHKAAGGIIPGTGRGDHVPLLGEPGEFVMRRSIVQKFGPTFFAKLNEGMEPQRFSSGGIVSRANRLEAQHKPYVWGGGHGDGGKRGWDCSGAVSYVLGIAPRVSGALMNFGLPGPGSPNDTKIYANPVHTFMVINGRGFGTSRENPGGGAGWISYNHRPGFAIRHLNDSGSGGKGNPQERVEAGKRRLGIKPGKGSTSSPSRATGVAGLDRITAPSAAAVGDTGADFADTGGETVSFAGVQADAINQALNITDLRARAGVITEEEAQSQKLSMIDQWLAGAIGPLDETQSLELMATRRDITSQVTAAQQAQIDAQEAAAAAAREVAAETKGLREEMARANGIAESTLGTQMRELTKAFADLVSGQLGYKTSGRALLAGDGRNARY